MAKKSEAYTLTTEVSGFRLKCIFWIDTDKSYKYFPNIEISEILSNLKLICYINGKIYTLHCFQNQHRSVNKSKSLKWKM